MYPHDVSLLGLTLSIWNATFLVAVIVGYPILRLALHYRCGEPAPRLLPLRWLVTVYVSVLGAQLFAYLFDLNTAALPPHDVSWARYYLDPFFGPKTLYGAIVFLPLTVLAVSVPWRDLTYGAALDAWTPALFVVLAVARVGCFLEGCCYGVRSAFGVSFPPAGALYHSQLSAGLIPAGARTLPVVPTQLLEGVALLALGATTMSQVRRGRTGIFLAAIVAYSAFRFLLEFVRDDPDRNFLGPLSTSQWIALAVLGGYFLWRRAADA